MELRVLDENYNPIGIVDIFESLIWTERFSEYGDFEITLPMGSLGAQYLLEGVFIECSDATQPMVIEDHDVETGFDTGGKLTVSGRSLVSLLDRRIIWNRTILSGDLQTAVHRLLNENAINPINSLAPETAQRRKIPGLVFKQSISDLSEMEIEGQFFGDNLYDAIKAICDVYTLGFKISRTEQGTLEFELYTGVDRSFSQNNNQQVIFSPEYDNLLNSKYLYSKKVYKNVTLVSGEEIKDGQGNTTGATKLTATYIGENEPSGLDRREIFTDANDIHSESENEGEPPLDDATYKKQLRQRGQEHLYENSIHTEFEGQMETHIALAYGVDYYIGDIVEVSNEYGMSSRARIIEFIRSESAEGIEEYPTFATLE